MCIHYDRIHHQKPSTSCLGFMLRLSKKCCRLEHLRFRGKYRVAMNTAYRFTRATFAVDYARSVEATHMGSIEEDLDWSGTLLGGLTIMPYVSHSVSGDQPWLLYQACLGYTDQDCGDHRI